MIKNTILDRWHITIEELTQLVDDNPSLRGFIMGYLAEHKIRMMLVNDSRISNPRKFDDHDRGNKHDLVVSYKGHDFSFEFKSLQTNSISRKNGQIKGTFQCDASDKRTISLPDGSEITTTCLRFGDFDILGINMFYFNDRWEYAFALNRDLPCSTYAKYPVIAREQLIKSLIGIELPLKAPFVSDPFTLLDRLAAERSR